MLTKRFYALSFDHCLIISLREGGTKCTKQVSGCIDVFRTWKERKKLVPSLFPLRKPKYSSWYVPESTYVLVYMCTTVPVHVYHCMGSTHTCGGFITSACYKIEPRASLFM